MSNDDERKDGSNMEVGAVNPIIKLAPFWPNSPHTWFKQAEAQFSVHRIKNEFSKYSYVVASLPQDIADSIVDVLDEIPDINQYTELKKVLIERYSLGIEKRIRMILSDQEMGDKIPSEFYRYLKNLAGTSGTVGDELIRKIWQSRLPNLINIALIPHRQENVDRILQVADDLHDAMQAAPSVSIVDHSRSPQSHSNLSQSHSHSSQTFPGHRSVFSQSGILSNNSNGSQVSFQVDSARIESLERQVSELKGMIARMGNERNSRSFSRNGRYRSNSRSRSRSSRRRFNANSNLCWYHIRFGDRATKCVQPCSGATPSSNSISTN